MTNQLYSLLPSPYSKAWWSQWWFIPHSSQLYSSWKSLRLKMSGDLLGKEKALHLDWGKKLHDFCDLLILGPSLSFPVGLDPFFHTKMDLQMGPVTTPFSPQVDKSPTAFSMNPLSLEGLWTLLPEPCDSYVRTLDMSATTISPEGVHQPLVFLALLVSMLKSVLRTSVWLLISCIHTLTE